MDFKVFFAQDQINSTNPKINDNIIEKHEIIDEYKIIDDFYCFKIINKHSITEKGIQKDDNDIVNSMEFLEINNAKFLVSLGFIFINSKNSHIYLYNCKTKYADDILALFFKTKCNTSLDHDKLKKISKLKLTLKHDPQLSLLKDNSPIQGTGLIKELEITDQNIQMFTITYQFSKGGCFFNKRYLSKILDKYDGLSIEGTDDDDNIINIIKNNVQLSITIDLTFSNFEELNSKKFDEIIKLLLQKEEEKLHGYKTNI